MRARISSEFADTAVSDVSSCLIHWHRSPLAVIVLVILLAVGCGGDTGGGDGNGGNGNGNGTPQPNMTVSGTAQGLTQQGQSTALSGARIVARVDRDGDGSIGEGERFETTTDASGAYSVEVIGQVDRRLVVSFRFEMYAEQLKTLQLEAVADVEVNAALLRSEPLDCQATGCRTEDRSLQLQNLPEGLSGTGRTFNPVVDLEAFPGDFADDTGNLLISGVFAQVELTDDQGNAVDQLDEPANLKMRFPRDTWSVIRDIESDNGQIDVPLYAFDEATGQWVRDGQAVLVDADDAVIDESELEEIRSGDFSGVIYASGDVSHFSYWNVDWPIETHGSISGTVTTGGGSNGGQPAEGGKVDVSGTTYTGRSSPQVLGSGGAFCVDVLRSEEPNEDIDGDGRSGETNRVAVRVTYQGVFYDLGEVEVSRTQSSCREGESQDLGELTLTPDKELTASLCEFEVDVVDIEEEPVEGAFIYAFDNDVPFEVFQDLCISTGGENICTFAEGTDENGRATITTPVIDRLSLFGSASGVNPEAQTSVRFANRPVRGCPSEPLLVRLDQGYDIFDLEVTVQGNQISWQPDLPANRVIVGSDEPNIKWWVFTVDAPFDPPVSYGQVPDGARVFFPFDGSDPEPLVAGDSVNVGATGSDEQGIILLYDGTAAVE